MGTTSNYSWPYPESTDPVADGATDIQALADAADTTGRAIQLATIQRFADSTARDTALSGIEVEGMFAFLQDTDTLTYWDGSAWQEFATGAGPANFTDTATGTYSSGGTSYKYLTLTASGTITIDTAGLADVLIVGGGGASGASTTSGRCGGGGGAGGYAYLTSLYLPVGTLTVTIGAGGAGGAGDGTDGSHSRLEEYATGGGGGGSVNSASQGHNGISGGGGGDGSRLKGLSVNTYRGNDGADGGGAGTAGGGGGSSAAASTSTGGAGTSNSITNSATTYAAGGDGGTTGSGASVPGAANTGDGGTGPGTTGNGANGGSGVVIVRVEV